MFRGKKIIAIIPARGGSKGLPGKNIRILCGKPLVAHSIAQAKDSRYLDEVVVSTDDKTIAEISEKYGARVPFLRPAEFATDTARMADVILHTLDWAVSEGAASDISVLLQPTSPLRLASDIDGAIEALFAKNAKAIVSVCEAEHHPHLMNALPEDGCMKNFMKPEFKNLTRQEVTTSYRINGAVYIAYPGYLKKNLGWLGDDTYAYIMPKERSIDIDDKLDFSIAEFLMKGRGL